jgi:GT2 family glycosyltransferase
MTQLNIAICIPSKNRAADLARCLRSIEAQHAGPLQIVVIDQSDKKYDLPDMPGLIHIYDPRVSGSAAARNVALDLVLAEIVLFLDDDVELLPHCLHALAVATSKHQDAVGFQCAIEGPSEGLSWAKIHASIFHRGFFNSARVGRRDGEELRRLAGCAAAVRASLCDHIRFNESLVGYSFGEDWEYSYRARRYGRLLLVPEARLIHHVSPVNRLKLEQVFVDRWENFLYFYDNLGAKEYLPNRFWRLWWKIGESIHWMRLGLGCPVLGIRTKRAPRRGLTLQAKSAR